MSWMTARATLKMTETELTRRHSVRTVTHINTTTKPPPPPHHHTTTPPRHHATTPPPPPHHTTAHHQDHTTSQPRLSCNTDYKAAHRELLTQFFFSVYCRCLTRTTILRSRFPLFSVHAESLVCAHFLWTRAVAHSRLIWLTRCVVVQSGGCVEASPLGTG